MAANVSVTYSFINGTSADATQVNQNFTDLVTWINTNAVHLDGSKAFTGAPSYAADPVSGNQLTRKSYTDGLVAAAVPQTVFKEVKLRRLATQVIPLTTQTSISWDTEDADTSGFITSPATTLTVPSGCDGTYAIGLNVAQAVNNRTNMYLIVNGVSQLVVYNGASTSRANAGFVTWLAAGDTVRIDLSCLDAATDIASSRLTMTRIAD